MKLFNTLFIISIFLFLGCEEKEDMIVSNKTQLSFMGDYYSYDNALFFNETFVSENGFDQSGRFHTLYIYNDDISFGSSGSFITGEIIGKGDLMIINFTTTTDNVGNIVGSFSNFGGELDSQDPATIADNSWLESYGGYIEDYDFPKYSFSIDEVTSFLITKEEDIYTINIKGEGTRYSMSGGETGPFELRYEGMIEEVQTGSISAIDQIEIFSNNVECNLGCPTGTEMLLRNNSSETPIIVFFEAYRTGGNEPASFAHEDFTMILEPLEEVFLDCSLDCTLSIPTVTLHWDIKGAFEF